MKIQLLSCAALFSVGFFLAGQAQEKGEEVTVRVVKYDGLKEEVLKHRGKVVVVDFWADFCLPCKARFPHMVETHRKYAKDGFTMISVSLDSLDENREAAKAKVHGFLKKQGAAFPNLILDEDSDLWEKKLRFNAIPNIYVFSRQGKWTQFDAQSLDDHPRKLDDLIEELVREK